MTRPVPLFLAISPADPRPIVRQIADGIRLALATGELPVGAALPSVRGLAQQLAVNPKTVAKAYDELVAEGWLHARQGLGLFVAEEPQRLSDTERERRLALAIETFGADVIGLGYTTDQVIERVRTKLLPMLVRRSA